MKKYIVLIFSLFFLSLPSFANTELIKIADRFQALVGGIGIVLIAIIFDRISQKFI
jgi:hypothetical protein